LNEGVRMEKRTLWVEDDLEANGKKYVPLCDTISLEEHMRFRALLRPKDILKKPQFDIITRAG